MPAKVRGGEAMPYYSPGEHVSLEHVMLRRLRFLSFALPLLVLAGCGGGGGGTHTGGGDVGVRIVTDWSGHAGITGASERITISKPDGSTAVQRVVNANATSTTTNMLGPSTGAYTVRVELFSGADATGTVVGKLESTTTSGSSAMNIAVGASASTIRFAPSTADIALGSSIHFGVVGVDASGNYTFLAPGSVTITSSGSSAAVTADGTATGVSTGTTTLTAKSGAMTATGVVNVATAGTRHAKWTVMVFLNASNNLYPYALPNINQMEQVAYNPDVQFVVQWKESAKLFGAKNVDFDGTRRYLIKSDSSSKLKSTLIQDMGANVDMGSVDTLHDFISWTKTNYPADRYAVVVWDHGNGWQSAFAKAPKARSVSLDDEFGSQMDIWDLPKAFEGQHVDILSFDACLMQMLEVASEMKGSADYIACSEENTPGPGYPYQRVFKLFADSPDLDTRSLTKSFVDGHIGNPDYANEYVTQSVIDTTKVAAVETALDTLATQMIANQASLTSIVPALRGSMQKYAYVNDGRNYYDLVDLTSRLQSTTGVPQAVRIAASNVTSATTNAVVWEGHSSLDAMSHGLAIDFSPSTGLQLNNYAKLNLAKVTHWDEWLQVAP